MIWFDLPFSARIAVLLAILAIVAAVERLVRGARATRGRAYSQLLVAGALGAAFGAAFDQLSVTVSPLYFVFGKGLPPGPGMRLRVAAFGAEAGCRAGLVAGGVLLVAAGPNVAWQAFLRAARTVATAALVGAPLGALFWSPRVVHGFLEAPIHPDVARAIAVVSGLHAGVYAGAAFGLALAGRVLYRSRALPDESTASSSGRPSG